MCFSAPGRLRLETTSGAIGPPAGSASAAWGPRSVRRGSLGRSTMRRLFYSASCPYDERCVARGYQPHFLRAPCWTGRGIFAKFKFGWELVELEGVPLRCVTIVSNTSNPGLPTPVTRLSPATLTPVLEDLLHRMTVQQPSAFFPEQSLPSLRT
jgi:hypothetical protein